ncbi:MAG: FAD-binding oxidoreductase [Rhizobiaceae bacterium]|nr:FAD-binding oxidoreductase [Rhizobiaceae bacterium]
MTRHLTEWRGLYVGEALAIVRPGSTEEVAALMREAAGSRLSIVPQGGNTGLVGGQIPFGGAREIVLSTERLRRIRDVDPAGNTLVAEAGVTLAEVQAAAEAADRFFPLSLAAEGTCTIGGNLATNAGGTGVIAYGNARDLALGLEVVLADGRIWNGLGRLRKDNTGYDLKNLFIGSEGTLGIITAAVLKLFPRPRSREAAFCAVPSPAAALALLGMAQAEAGSSVTTFELMAREALGFVLKHAPNVRDPLAEASPWYVLLELSSPREEDLGIALESILSAAFEAGEVTDAALAASLDQRQAFWRLRDAMSEVQGLEGGSIKHDVSVPLPALPAFVAEATRAVLRLVPGCRPAIFGHVGDGNLHFNVSQPVGADKADYLRGWEEMNAVVHAVVLAHGGSISAEHGIGRLKRDLMPGAKDPVALDLMHGLKTLLDPASILNPGKVLPARPPALPSNEGTRLP